MLSHNLKTFKIILKFSKIKHIEFIDGIERHLIGSVIRLHKAKSNSTYVGTSTLSQHYELP